MKTFNPREQNLIDSLNTRLAEADAITTDVMLKEREASEEYKNPGHPDHTAYLHMIPLAMGRQMELSGQDPLASGTDMDSSMLHNQRFTHDVYPQEDDREYLEKRKRLSQYKNDIENGKIQDENISKDDLLAGVKSLFLEIDTDHDYFLNARDTEVKRMAKQETEWEKEETTRRIEVKKDFMATRLRNILPDALKEAQELADIEWNRLQSDYGF